LPLSPTAEEILGSRSSITVIIYLRRCPVLNNNAGRGFSLRKNTFPRDHVKKVFFLFFFFNSNLKGMIYSIAYHQYSISCNIVCCEWSRSPFKTVPGPQAGILMRKYNCQNTSLHMKEPRMDARVPSALSPYAVVGEVCFNTRFNFCQG
jgi:hypothetical protein